MNEPRFRDLNGLGGGLPRDYAHDVFWVSYSLKTAEGQPLFTAAVREAELVVRIYGKSGKVRWVIPDSVRSRLAQ